MRSYYRVMLDKGSSHAAECLAGNFIGASGGIVDDLTGKLPDEWRAFNRAYIPIFQAAHTGKSKVAAGLACGSLWTVARGIATGDIVLCPDGTGTYRVGEVIGDYVYAAGQPLPHHRPVRWMPVAIDRASMSEALQNSTGSIGTVCNITNYREEIEKLILNQA